MSAVTEGNIEISASNAYIFTNTSNFDLVMYTTMSNQRILMGTQCNSISAVIIDSNVSVNTSLAVGRSNPIATLDVSGTIRMAGGAMTVSNNIFTYGVSTFCNTIVAASNIVGLAPMSFCNNVTFTSNVYVLGQVGINTSNPVDSFTIAASNFSISNFGRTMIFGSNNNLGLGTQNPLTLLHVNGDTTLNGNLVMNAPFQTRSIQVMKNTTNAPPNFAMYNAPGVTFNAGSMYITTAGSNSTEFVAIVTGSNPNSEKMRVTGSGAVGIGTQAPFGRLQIGHTLFPNSNNIVIEAGNLSDNSGVGWSAINFNGYFSTTEQRININKNRWRIGVDQRTTTDNMFIDCFNGTTTTGIITALSNGNVGLGITPTTRLHVSGDITATGFIRPSAGSAATNGIYFPTDPGGGGGDAGFIRYYARSGEACTLEIGTTNDVDDHIYLNPTGNVGIATNGPGYKLDVSGTTRVTSTFIAQGSVGVGTTGPAESIHSTNKIYTQVQFLSTSNDSVTVPSYSFREDSNTGIYHPADDSLGFVTAGAERARITSTGNVGIGTTNPSVPLAVLSGNAGNLKLVNNSANAGDAWWLGFGHNSDSTDGNDRARIGVNILGGGAGRIYFTTGVGGAQVERIRIDEVGRLGLGTNAPSSLLHMNSNTSNMILLTNTSNNSGVIFGIENAADTNGGFNALFWNNSNAAIRFGTSNVERARITPIGNVGIGTTAPTSLLQMTSNNSNMVMFTNASNASGVVVGIENVADTNGGFNALLWNNSNAAIRFGTSNVERIRITSNGNLGIGMTNPLYTVDVTGITRVSSNALFPAGGYITSFTAGTATWLDLPTTGPSGIGTGGPGQNAWIGYAQANGQWFANSATAGDICYRNTAGRVLIGTNSTQHNLAIAANHVYSSNNIGIGTSNVTNPLTVSGGASIGSGFIANTSPVNGLIVQGNVGIGTSNPGSALSVSGGTSVGTAYSNAVVPTNGLAVQGNVGIGTSNPSFTLDVVGTVKGGSAVGTSIGLTDREIKLRGDGQRHYSIFNSNGIFMIHETSTNSAFGTLGSNLITSSNFMVGIGTSNPGSMLSVAGGAVFGYSAAAAPANGLLVQGACTLCNNLTVFGTTSFSNPVVMFSNLTVNGILSVSNVTYVTSNIVVFTNEIIQSNLSVYNAATLCNALTVFGTTTLSNVTILNSNLTFSNFGAVTLYTSNNLLGIGISNPSYPLDLSTGPMRISATMSNRGALILTGTSYYTTGVSDASGGVQMAVGYNASGNRQLWIMDTSSNAINATNVAARVLTGLPIPIFDAITTDGNTGKMIQLGNSAGTYFTGNIGYGTSNTSESIQSTAKIYSQVQLLGPSNDSVTIPSHSWKEDSNTGMFHASNDAIGFTTNGNERMRITDIGNVGIGTTTPSQILHISGTTPTLLIQNTDTTTANTQIRFAHNNGTLLSEIGVFSQSNIFIANKQNGAISFETNATERMNISSVGNLGIGIQPSAKVHVLAPAGELRIDGSNTFSALSIVNNSNGSAMLGLAYNPGQYSTSAGSNDVVLRNTSTIGKIHLQNGTGVAALTINSNNNVGIGITTPAQILDVNGSVVLRSNTSIGSATNPCLLNISDYDGTTDGTRYGIVQITRNNVNVLSASNTASMSFIRMGNFVWGLGYNNGNNTFGFGSGTQSNAHFTPSVLSMTSTGFVGIGNSNAAYRLDVSGDINFTGILRQNGTAYIGSQWSNNSTNVFVTGSNVGIGTTSPGSPLTVISTSTTVVPLSVTGSGTGGGGSPIAQFLNSNGIPVVLMGSHTNSNLYINYSSNTNTAQLGIFSATNTFNITPFSIGIGTTTPHSQSKLHLSGPGISNQLHFSISDGATNAKHWAFGPNGATFYGYMWDDTFTTTANWIQCTRTANSVSNVCFPSGNIGIGITAPNAALQFSNVIANRRIVLWENTNNDHQYFGFGINASLLRFQVDGTGSTHAFFASTSSTASTELMRIQGNGNVGIGTTSPSYRLHVSGGDIYCTGNITAFSDSNYKKDLERIENAVDKLSTLTGYTFAFTEDTSEQPKRYAGLLAQEVHSVLPEVVSVEPDTGKMGVSYGNMMALIVNAIKELKNDIQDLKQYVYKTQ